MYDPAVIDLCWFFQSLKDGWPGCAKGLVILAGASALHSCHLRILWGIIIPWQTQKATILFWFNHVLRSIYPSWLRFVLFSPRFPTAVPDTSAMGQPQKVQPKGEKVIIALKARAKGPSGITQDPGAVHVDCTSCFGPQTRGTFCEIYVCTRNYVHMLPHCLLSMEVLLPVPFGRRIYVKSEAGGALNKVAKVSSPDYTPTCANIFQ